VGQSGAFGAAFARSREMPRMLAAAEVKLRAIAEANLAGHPGAPPHERRAHAVFLAGGLVGLLRWWIESGLQQPPEQLHAAYSELARRTLAG
jgi:ferric-dicitrate binding protein FerR (iron transport regulator)